MHWSLEFSVPSLSPVLRSRGRKALLMTLTVAGSVFLLNAEPTHFKYFFSSLSLQNPEHTVSVTARSVLTVRGARRPPASK